MNLRYCIKCEETYFCDDRPCPVCGKKLYYFGREKVSLSPLHILIEYDIKHPYNPLKDYKGIYYIDTFSPELDSSILECEDVLKYKPDEPNALFFLGTTFFSKGDFKKAKGYLESLVKLRPMDPKPYRLLADIYRDEELPEKALEQLEEAKKLSPTDWELFDILGRTYLKLGKSKKALSAFMSAYKHCKDDEKKIGIKTVMRQISTTLESSWVS